MKHIRNIFIIIVMFACISLTSCNKNDHTHSFVEGICECGESDPNYVPPKPVKQIYWKFTIDGETVKEGLFDEGITPEYPSVPENADENYRWMKLESLENGQLCYEIILLYDVKICKITFVNQHGDVLKTENLEWGSDATAPVYPENYEVVWDKDFTNVKDDLVVVGNINKIYATVNFYDGDEKLDLGFDRYNLGEEITLPELEKEGYDFVGWYLGDISLSKYTKIKSTDSSDFNFYARYVKTDFSDIVLPDATNRIVQININGNYITPVVSGSTLEYTWKVSDDSIIGVSDYGSISVRSCGVCVLTAVYKNNPTITYNCLIEATSTGVRIVSEEELKNKQVHKVTFIGMNGDVIDEQIVPDGYTALYPDPFTYEGYGFNGWDKGVTNIKADTIINATYIEGSNRFEGKKVAVLGDSISTYLNYMPEGYAHFYPYPAGNIRDVNQMWWKEVSNALGTSIFVDNAWGGTTVVGGTSATESPTRLSTLLFGEEKPDVVLIFMGSNDARAKYTVNTFEQSYRKMITNIKAIAPDAEIILCGLVDFTVTGFFEKETYQGYNKVIEKVATDNEFIYIDLSSVKIVNSDLIDSVHPNYSGHKKIAEVVIEQLNKQK